MKIQKMSTTQVYPSKAMAFRQGVDLTPEIYSKIQKRIGPNPAKRFIYRLVEAVSSIPGNETFRPVKVSVVDNSVKLIGQHPLEPKQKLTVSLPWKKDTPQLKEVYSTQLNEVYA